MKDSKYTRNFKKRKKINIIAITVKTIKIIKLYGEKKNINKRVSKKNN